MGVCSHGHSDHIGGVANHASKRGLFSLKKARYYVPPLLVDSLRAVTDASFAMAVTTEALENVNIIPFGVGDNIKVGVYVCCTCVCVCVCVCVCKHVSER